MDMLRHFERLFAYDAWANREAIASLRRAASPPARSLALLAHIAAAQQIWLDRARQKPLTLPPWPELTLDECDAQLAALAGLWKDFLHGLPPDGLSRPFRYRNSKGEEWTNTVGDVLTHVVIHSAYHRGQIAADVRAAGHVPAQTDFIYAARQGAVDATER